MQKSEELELAIKAALKAQCLNQKTIKLKF